MNNPFVQIKSPQDLQPYCENPLIQSFDAANLERHKPDEHWLYVDTQHRPMARCSIWWQDVPSYEQQRLGVIGHYSANDSEAAQRLLRFASERLKQKDCTLAIGPMDGNTWHRYRLVTDVMHEPPFFLEPTNPPDWPQHWLNSGFRPLAHYCSALNTDLSQHDPRMDRAWTRLQQYGVSIRRLDLNHIDDELLRIYKLSLTSFVHNFLYTPIKQKDFLDQYRQILPYINPDLVLMAEVKQQLVGFLFALPDVLQAQRGETVNTVIVKTVAVLPERSIAGLGSVLVDKVQQHAHGAGYTRAIHALMHDTNKSRNISSHYANIMRRYVLFQKPLLP